MLDKELTLRREFESMSSEELRTMLHAETAKAEPDDDLVLAILHTLEDREPEELKPASRREEAAWKRFRKRVKARKRRLYLGVKSLGNVAVLLLAVGLLFTAIPQQAEADNWWNRVARWTDDFFGFFREEEEETFNLEDYEFKTDNPGLQQVYDAVVEMGVTEPVVPMWLPEGYELVELIYDTLPKQKILVACLSDAQSTVIYQAVIVISDGTTQYHKDNNPILKRQINNTVYNIMHNEDSWIVLWTSNNIECSLAIDCEENTLYEIIESIYRWRSSL